MQASFPTPNQQISHRFPPYYLNQNLQNHLTQINPFPWLRPAFVVFSFAKNYLPILVRIKKNQ